MDVHTILDISRDVIQGPYKTIRGSDGDEVIEKPMAFLADPDLVAYSSGQTGLDNRLRDDGNTLVIVA